MFQKFYAKNSRNFQSMQTNKERNKLQIFYWYIAMAKFLRNSLVLISWWMKQNHSLSLTKSEFFNRHKQTHIVPFIELDIWNRKLVYRRLFKNNAESYSKQCAMQIFETFYIASQEKGKHLRMGYLRVLWLNWEVCWILLWGWFQWNIGFSLQEQMVVY